MTRLRGGELSELGVLFERHHAKVFRYCLRMTGDPTTSEDLVQDVFTRILKYAATFRRGTNFEAWLFRVSRNVCYDHFRRSRREVELAAPDERPSTELPAVEALERDEDVGRLRQALGRLPDDRRELLILSRFEARRYAEIAELLDCSVGAVKVRVHRAMRQLRDIYMELASEATS